MLRLLLWLELELPPLLLATDAVPRHDDVVRGRELADAAERGTSRKRRPQREDLDDPDGIDLALRARVPKQSLCLGREADVSAELADEQGSHAETVAGEQELVARTIPDGEREVSVEAP